MDVQEHILNYFNNPANFIIRRNKYIGEIANGIFISPSISETQKVTLLCAAMSKKGLLIKHKNIKGLSYSLGTPRDIVKKRNGTK